MLSDKTASILKTDGKKNKKDLCNDRWYKHVFMKLNNCTVRWTQTEVRTHTHTRRSAGTLQGVRALPSPCQCSQKSCSSCRWRTWKGSSRTPWSLPRLCSRTACKMLRKVELLHLEKKEALQTSMRVLHANLPRLNTFIILGGQISI